MPRNYVPTGRPPGRPRKSVAMSDIPEGYAVTDTGNLVKVPDGSTLDTIPRVLTTNSVEQYAYEGMSRRAIAALLDMDNSTFDGKLKRDQELERAYSRGRARLQQKILQLQIDLFENGDSKSKVVMAIWLGKQYAGQADAPKLIKTESTTTVKYVAEWGEDPPPTRPELTEGDDPDVIDGECEEVDGESEEGEPV